MMKEKRIYINGRFLQQVPTGVNRYAYELCKALTILKVNFVIICPKGNLCDSYEVDDFNIIHWGIGHSHFWEQCVLPFFFLQQKGKSILVNFTGIGPVLVKNKIVTIHDLAFMFHPQWYSKTYASFYRILTPLSAKTALKVLTVSNFSKSEIIRMLHIGDRKIEVVYNAVPPCLMEEEPEYSSTENNISDKYVLVVSSIDPRKNFERLLKAFRYLEDTDLHLYIVGGWNAIYTSGSIQNEMDVCENPRIHWLGRVSDEELKSYYRQAACFVYPSLYEGFGIPPIEAMAMNCPAIVSDIPVLREVCGSAAIYVNPYNEKEMAVEIKRLCGDENLKEEMKLRGKKQLENYSWIKSAGKLYSIINSL
jgi:glycosyltransferase involved in cell wall biosynthesis